MSLRINKPLQAAVLVIMLAAAACSPAPESAPTATPLSAPAEEQAAATQVPTPTEEAAQALEPDEEAQEAVRPTPKQGLVATDPTTVDLASGGPKLVEFFAFW